jgi:vacuole morphology and inheritance protein 14
MASRDKEGDFPALADGLPILEKTAPTPTIKGRSLTMPSEAAAPSLNGLSTLPLETVPSRPESPAPSYTTGSIANQVNLQHSPVSTVPPEEIDPFDYQATVNALTIQFLSEHEETRVSALKWLLMLHQKAPKKESFLTVTNFTLTEYIFTV